MLLAKGVRMEIGESASTDGKEIIYLPQAMRRYLAWDEIDFVRYLVHHEHAHIKHSSPKADATTCSGAQNAALFGFVLNLLEDIRIEQLEINSGKGVAGVYNRGRSIALRMWKKHMDETNQDDLDVHSMLCHLVFCGCVHPELRDDDQVSKYGKKIEYLHMKFQLAGVYERVDRIRDSVQEFPSTFDLTDLTRLICNLLGQPEHLPEEMRPSREALGLDKNGDRESAQCDLMKQAYLEATQESQDYDTWSGGLAERMLKQELCDEDAPPSEVVTSENLKTSKHQQHLHFGAETRCDPCPESSRENYAWAEWAAGMSGQVIDRLRGQERASLSLPKQSGVRIAQRNAVPFLKGLTSDLLRRKKKSPRNGTAVVFCIDDSGSMAGEFSQNAWRAGGMLAIACDRAKIRTMVIRYSRSVKVEKLFAQPPHVLRNKLAMGMGGGTHAKRAIQTSHAHIRQRPEERKVIFFLSDGCTEDCRKLVREVNADGIEFIPILFGEGAAYSSLRGREWDLPQAIVIPDPTKVPLGPVIVDRLAATL